MTNREIVTVLETIRPGAVWTLRGNDYTGLEWLDTNQSKPTAQELGL